MATKKSKKNPKPMPPCRIFCGEQLYHEGKYVGSGEMEAVYHDNSMTDQFESMLSKRLTEAVRTILAENPDSGLSGLSEV